MTMHLKTYNKYLGGSSSFYSSSFVEQRGEGRGQGLWGQHSLCLLAHPVQLFLITLLLLSPHLLYFTAQSWDILSVLTHSLVDPIQSHGFKYHLYADVSQVYSSCSSLSPEVQALLSPCLFTALSGSGLKPSPPSFPPNLFPKDFPS